MNDDDKPAHEPEHSPLAQALAAFQGAMPRVAKTKTANAGTYSYKYADLADVVGATMPLLTRVGLSFSTVPRWTDHGYELVGVLMHSSGESMEGALPIAGGNPQALGSAITYARRYLFGCMTGVVTDDDDDGHAATPAKATRAPRKKAAEPPPETQRAKAMKLMFALMRDLGLNDRATSMAYVQKVIGRQIESRNDLTDAELSRVIDVLQHEGVPEAPLFDGGEADTPLQASPPSPQPANDSGMEWVTPPMQKMIGTMFGRLGVGDDTPGRQERLRIVAQIVGRPVGTFHDLTLEEGQTVLDTLGLAGGNLQTLHTVLDKTGEPLDGP